MSGVCPGTSVLSPEAAHIARAKSRPRSSVLRPGYCLAVGGNATAGRFVSRPWPHLLERRSGRVICNFARPHAGLDAMIGNVELMRVAALAELRLIEVPDAITMTNGYYAVHPRRNDRFVRAEPALIRLYPEVDFTQFSFTRHLVISLWAQDPERFELLRAALSARWLARMEELLHRLDGRSVLIWWAKRPPLAPGAEANLRPGAPQLVDHAMLEAVRPRVDGLVKVVIPEVIDDPSRKRVDPAAVVAAHELPSEHAHGEIARQLLPWLRLP